jgi:hypothetical protein
MRFVVLMAVNIKIMVFLDVIPCSLLNRNQHFGGTHWLHLQGRGQGCSNLKTEGAGSSSMLPNLRNYTVSHPKRPLPTLPKLHFNTFYYCISTHLMATATDPQSSLSRRQELWCWNELEVNDEEHLFVSDPIHWCPQMTRQKACLGLMTKYEASQCFGLHFLYCLRYCVQTSLNRKRMIGC